MLTTLVTLMEDSWYPSLDDPHQQGWVSQERKLCVGFSYLKG